MVLGEFAKAMVSIDGVLDKRYGGRIQFNNC